MALLHTTPRIAEMMDRTVGSVVFKAHTLKVSLKARDQKTDPMPSGPAGIEWQSTPQAAPTACDRSSPRRLPMKHGLLDLIRTGEGAHPARYCFFTVLACAFAGAAGFLVAGDIRSARRNA